MAKADQQRKEEEKRRKKKKKKKEKENATLAHVTQDTPSIVFSVLLGT